MVVGLPNPNIMLPVAKLCITNLGNGEKIYVLYNPESYVQSRSVKYSDTKVMSGNVPVRQFVNGEPEQLTMELFFDTFSASSEAGGTAIVKSELALSSRTASAAKADVRKYTSKVYNLMLIDKSTHAPPVLKIEWGSLIFKCHLVECSQKFTKFNEFGKPVRAVLNVTFTQFLSPTEAAELSPNESPDTAKYRTVHQGDALWALAVKEYGLSSAWRKIADANMLENPRLLKTGETLRLPAEK